MRKIWMPIAAVLLASVILLVAYNCLLGVRADVREAELQAKMAVLLPGSTNFVAEEYTGEDENIAFVYKAEGGYVIGTQTSGYAGTICMLIGVNNDGQVTGLQVRSMEETLGLGAQALTDWEFLAQFLGADEELTVGEDIDALTGATVTTKAITRSVNSAVAFVTGDDVSSGATSWGG